MLTRSKSFSDLKYDPEIERTARRLRKETRERKMAERRRTMQEYLTPTSEGDDDSIVIPAVEANNFELKPALLNMIQSSMQFGGTPHEDPNLHIKKFLRFTDTIKYNGVSTDAIRLRLFPFSVTEGVNEWLSTLPAGSITSWDGLKQAFLGKYFPPSRAAQLIAEISSYRQYDHETLYEAWTRFKGLLRKCPHHGFPDWRQVQLFYNGLFPPNRAMVDAACGGTIMKKAPAEAYALIDEMAASSFQWQAADQPSMRKRETVAAYQTEGNDPLAKQVEALTKQLATLMKAQDFAKPSTPSECDHCGSVSHESTICPVRDHWAKQQEEANYLGNNNYNSGWRNDSNNSWGNSQGGQSSNVYRPPHLQNQGARPERPEPSKFSSNFQETMLQYVHSSEK